MNIYPTISTTKKADWRSQIAEIASLRLTEVCFFPTCLELKERKEAYQLLKETQIKKIPLVHLRSDMELWELDYLTANYQVVFFNIHSQKQFPLSDDFKKYISKIYIENTVYPLATAEIDHVAGVCVDFSHLENARLVDKERYQNDIQTIHHYPHRCGHISSIRNTPHFDEEWGTINYHYHRFKNLSEFDYLRNYRDIFPEVAALELENSIAEQLKVNGYLVKLLQ